MATTRRLIAAIAVFALLMLPIGAHAAGSSWISGSATDGAITWYYTSRYVSNPSTPGPEVAFNKSTGPGGLMLGTHNCGGGGAGPYYLQSTGSWQPVRFYSVPQSFCMLSVSNSGSGSFSGTLAWD